MGFYAKLVADDTDPVLNSDVRIVRTHRLQYLVTNDFPLSNMEVLQTMGVAIGNTHPDDGLATLRSCPCKRRFTKQDTKPSWDVTLTYSTDAPENVDDPTQMRAKRAWGSIEEQRYIIKDRNGKLILNKAGDPPAGGIPITVRLPCLTFERNEADFSSSTAKTWSGSLNQSAFAGCDPKTLQLRVTGEEVYEAKSHYWRVKYEMVQDEDGWQPKFLNAGTRELIGGQLVPIEDLMNGGQPITDAVPLDNSGRVIDPTTLPDAAIFLTAVHFQEREFQQLGLPEF